MDWDSRWSTPSLSPLNSGDLALDNDNDTDDDVGDESDISSDQVRELNGSLVELSQEKSTYNHPPHSYAHRREFEILQGKQYWRDAWKGDGNVVEKKAFNMSDASTLGKQLPQIVAFWSDPFTYLGPALRTILRPPSGKSHPGDVNFDFLVQREVRVR